MCHPRLNLTYIPFSHYYCCYFDKYMKCGKSNTSQFWNMFQLFETFYFSLFNFEMVRNKKKNIYIYIFFKDKKNLPNAILFHFIF